MIESVIQINEYNNILNDNKNHFNKLYTICKETGENVEGNCFTEHLNIDSKINELIYKQMNHFSLGQNATNIMEIGFNAGHSSLLYLLSNPKSKLTIFDSKNPTSRFGTVLRMSPWLSKKLDYSCGTASDFHRLRNYSYPSGS